MPKKTKRARHSVQTAIRFTDVMDAAIRSATVQIASERPGQEVNHADTIRILVAEALRARKITND